MLRAITFLLFCLVTSAQSTPWFTSTNLDTTCHATTVTATPLAFGFYCSNPRGAVGGSYTAAATNTATDSVTVGLSGPTGTVLCMFGINATAAPFSLGSFGTIPAGTVAWQCSAQGSTSGTQGSFALKFRTKPLKETSS